MHLAERCRGCRLRLETPEAVGPVGAQFRNHAPAHERRPHRWGLRLQLGELLGIFGGQSLGMVAISCATFMIGPFRPPSAAAKAAAFLLSSASRPNSRWLATGRHRTHVGADLDVAGRARAEAVFFLVVAH
jgi:hypothetical protein